MYIFNNDIESKKCSMKFLIWNTKLVSHRGVTQIKECDIRCINWNFLRGLYQWIQEYQTRKIENIIFPEVLSHFQQEEKHWNDKLSHLHPKFMFRQANHGVLPKLFLDLKDDVTLCASCIFGPKTRQNRQQKVINQGSHKKTLKIHQELQSQLINFSQISQDYPHSLQAISQVCSFGLPK